MPQRRIAAKSPASDPEHNRILVETTNPLSLDGSSDDDYDDDDLSSKNNNDGLLNDELLAVDHEQKIQLWKESPFATGLTEPTWLEERKRTMSRNIGRSRGNNNNNSSSSREPGALQQQRIPDDETGCLWISAFICPFFGASRVGNMVVLSSRQEKTEEITIDPETGERTVRRLTRPKLDIVVGPYWPMMLFVTYPLILAVSGWTLMSISSTQKPILLVLVWFICTTTLIVALAFTACRDPGILYRTQEAVNESWRWNDSALSYRPPGSWYDGDTAVVVEGFDHT